MERKDREDGKEGQKGRTGRRKKRGEGRKEGGRERMMAGRRGKREE